MAIAYRPFQARYGPQDATGSRLIGGRWNSSGKAVLYASDTLALCCLEILVHLRDTRFLPEYEFCSIEIPDNLIRSWPFAPEQPRHGAIVESDVLSREFGDEFLDDSALLYPRRPAQAVPSVILPAGTHWNYLLDPGSPSFDALKWSERRVFTFKPRLLSPDLR